jgi:hypothetical protein
MAASIVATDPIVIWEPQPGPQEALLSCSVFEVFFGGARGGGKTDGMLGEWLSHSDLYGIGAIGLMVRRTREELVETYERAKVLFTPLGFKFNDSEHRCTGPTGARLRFAYLERDADAEKYQGHSYTRVYVEEIGNFPSPGPVLKLMATLRSATGVPCCFRATGNPGGPGHHWVRARYIDPAPMGWQIITDPKTGLKRVYIPSRVSDNRLLMANDPQYVAKLRASGNETLVRAWLEGDWSVITGAYFPEFSLARHVVQPRELPGHWARFRAMDWGSAKPFSVGWYAVSDGELPEFPRGAIIKYREWYGASEPNVGLKLVAEAVGEGIAYRESADPKITMGVLDPAAFAQDGGPSLAERIYEGSGRRVVFRPADNARTAQRGAMGGWDQLRSRLVGDGDGRPMIYFFSTCVDTIRTIPALQHDELRPEDVDTDGEDHAADETRYACMSRPFVRSFPATPPGKVLRTLDGSEGLGVRQGISLDDLWAARNREQRSRI